MAPVPGEETRPSRTTKGGHRTRFATEVYLDGGHDLFIWEEAPKEYASAILGSIVEGVRSSNLLSSTEFLQVRWPVRVSAI
jgi:hypothetical protein